MDEYRDNLRGRVRQLWRISGQLAGTVGTTLKKGVFAK
nr:MAG TPA: hypothetical protein [Caudoviricetes sp.]